MKRKLLLSVTLCLTAGLFAQAPMHKPKPSGIENTKALQKLVMNENASTSQQLNNPTKAQSSPVLQANSNAKTNAVNSWTNVSTSGNIYGVLISYCKPLQYNDELNAVSFIHRKPTSYVANPVPAGTAANGLMLALASSNMGQTWDSTLIWNDNNNWGRYPGGGIYNPLGNTTFTAAYVVGIGPTTAAAGGWPGNFYASKQLSVMNNVASTAPNAQQWMDIANPNPTVGRHDFAAYSFASTDDGKIRNLAGITDDNTGADTAIMLVTGVFNSGVFAYSGTPFVPPVTLDGAGDRNFVSRPVMAWNEAGTVGYVAVVGQKQGATGAKAGLQPLVWKTTNSGASWAMIPEIDFNNAAFSIVKQRLTSQGSSTLEVPNFTWLEGIDMTVDANDKLHLFTVPVGHYSADPDSLNYYSQFGSEEYRWVHSPGLRPYLYDFMTDGSSGWSFITVDSMSTEGPAGLSTGAGFNDNPWTLNGADKVRMDARLQLSRSPNGKYIYYSWTESDTNFTSSAKKWNVLPNIKCRAYDVDGSSLFAQKINVSNPASGANPNVASRATYYCVSPKTSSATVTAAAANTVVVARIPYTVSQNPTYDQLTNITHWYNTAEVTFTKGILDVSVRESALNSANNCVLFPNPASNNASVIIDLVNNEKVEFAIFNLMGQLVKVYAAEGQTGENHFKMDLQGINSGIYMVNVKVANASSTKKLIIE